MLLVCSSGGHLLQLCALRDSWAAFSRAWVTFDKSDARSLLSDERVFYAYGPTNVTLADPRGCAAADFYVVPDGRLGVRLVDAAGAPARALRVELLEDQQE